VYIAIFVGSFGPHFVGIRTTHIYTHTHTHTHRCKWALHCSVQLCLWLSGESPVGV